MLTLSGSVELFFCFVLLPLGFVLCVLFHCVGELFVECVFYLWVR